MNQRGIPFQVLAFHKSLNLLLWNPSYEKIITINENNSLVFWNINDNVLFKSQT